MRWHRSQGGARVMLGGFLELAPAPGEEETRIVQLLAAWSEAGAGSQHRAYARVRRFYRPTETIFSGQPQELFSSGGRGGVGGVHAQPSGAHTPRPVPSPPPQSTWRSA